MKKLIRDHKIVTTTMVSLLAVVIVVGATLVIDIRSLDSEQPIDWDSMDQTVTGYRQVGILFDIEFDCTTGRLRLETPIVGVDVMTAHRPWVATHNADEACHRRGFDPQFSREP